jgi:hypothetical protein
MSPKVTEGFLSFPSDGITLPFLFADMTMPARFALDAGWVNP